MDFNSAKQALNQDLRIAALDRLAEFERVIEALRTDGVLSNKYLDIQIADFRDNTTKYLSTLD